jgi:NitT/TauT family transport system permease protein
MRARLARAWPAVLGLLLMIGAWEAAVAWFRVPAYVVPPLHAIVRRAVLDAGSLGVATLVTTVEALAGFAAGAGVGLLFAVAFVVWPPLERVLLPSFVAFNSVPVVAYAPVAVIWFGIGFTSKIVLVTVVVGFTVLLNTLQGLKSCDPAAVALLRSFGAGRLRTLWTLELPHAMPALFTGLRVGAVRSMIIAIVAEMLGAYRGIGWTIFESTSQMDFLKVWAMVAVASAVSIALYLLVAAVDRRVVWWR